MRMPRPPTAESHREGDTVKYDEGPRRLLRLDAGIHVNIRLLVLLVIQGPPARIVRTGYMSGQS